MRRMALSLKLLAFASLVMAQLSAWLQSNKANRMLISHVDTRALCRPIAPVLSRISCNKQQFSILMRADDLLCPLIARTRTQRVGATSQAPFLRGQACVLQRETFRNARVGPCRWPSS